MVEGTEDQFTNGTNRGSLDSLSGCVFPFCPPLSYVVPPLVEDFANEIAIFQPLMPISDWRGASSRVGRQAD